MLAAGLDGIEQELLPPPPVNEDVYLLDEEGLKERGIETLPGTLAEALDELERDRTVQDALGKPIVETILRARRAEWEEYRIRVTPWELERYLETA